MLCGDRVRMEVAVRDGVVIDAAFAASACAIATASASLLTDHVRGRAVDEALRTDEESVVAALGVGVPAARRGCATLPWRGVGPAPGRGGGGAPRGGGPPPAPPPA